MDRFDEVLAFHDKFGQPYDGPPRMLSYEEAAFRINFLLEEVTELADALGFKVLSAVHIKPLVSTVDGLTVEHAPVEPAAKRLAAALDALVDLDYVTKGTVLLMGLGAAYGEAFDRVHQANLAKERAPTGTFKIVKPSGWQAPDLTDLVE